tara:strand:+ start:536 stop:643 length:108 start_codon:yes stop_codon:yes gene_type:complete
MFAIETLPYTVFSPKKYPGFTLGIIFNSLAIKKRL